MGTTELHVDSWTLWLTLFALCLGRLHLTESSSSQLRRTLESQQQQLDNQVDAHQRSLQELNTHTAKMVDDVAKALRTSQQGVNAGLRQHQTRLKEFQRAETNRGQEEVSLLLRKLKEKLAANLADSKRRTEQLVESNQTQTQEIMTCTCWFSVLMVWPCC